MEEGNSLLDSKDAFVNIFSLEIIPPQGDKYWMVKYTPLDELQEQSLRWAFGTLETELQRTASEKLKTVDKLNDEERPIRIFNQSGSNTVMQEQYWEFWLDKSEKGRKRLEEEFLPRITDLAKENLELMKSLG